MPTVLVLNGPNLNLLGQREPEVYGRETLADVERLCRETGERLGLGVECHQDNHEGGMVDAVQGARGRVAGIVVNAAAYTHTSVALRDALATFEGPVVEVHISNVHAREPFRAHSYLSDLAAAVIVGCGARGYRYAIEEVAARLS